MRLLIATFPGDVHALEVALVLRARGHEVVQWFGGDFPTLQTASVDLDGTATRWSASGKDLELAEPSFDVVWNRRSAAPVLPERMHPGDRPVAQRECQDFLDCLAELCAPRAFWVNPLASRRRADLKLVQLHEARRAGLEIPRTLSSNDPRRIRAFLAEAGGPVIYKAFYPALWRDGDELAHLLTSEVDAASLPPDDVLRLTPGIFQPRIEKAHELRVTVMGARTVTARIVSQAQAATRLDWRARTLDLGLEPDELPAAVERGVHELMRRLGLVFGCLDFIVTPDGRHVFLEVNPMGQFLWVEHANPSLRVLGPFCEFLLARGGAAGAGSCSDVRHGDWFARAHAEGKVAAAAHVRWANDFESSDANPPVSGRSGTEVHPEGVSP
jgi:glutathione synthase/RimK-type ligase-like ATP-grasp enzyme